MAGNGFNIFDYVDDFKKAGMSQEQANVLARALQNIASENAATKHDLEFAKLELKKDIELIRRDIEQLRTDTITAIEQLRSDTKKDITNSIYLTVVALSAIIYTMAKFGMLSIK